MMPNNNMPPNMVGGAQMGPNMPNMVGGAQMNMPAPNMVAGAQMGPNMPAPNQVAGAQMPMMPMGPVKMCPPIVHPTKCCVQHTFSTTVVPHIHPTHTTVVNHQNIQHKHYFPQTNSMVNSVSNQQFNCGGGRPPMSPYGR
ncbi:CotD family spore coat protein [Metabacillus indicus]|uniref:CotD family spore coat protein n=1 Tax=Metabacillus indicus TaxID=246786 RepID=UPI003CF3968F